MAEQEQPQLYLISPPQLELSGFSALLSDMLDRFETACFRLDLISEDEDEVARSADLLREICHQRDVAIVIARHFRLVDRLGLDGVHLPDGARLVRDVRKELGADAIVGAYCAASRHNGMAAGEAGADYVSFGPVSASALGDGDVAGRELFEWWSEMIEVPVVAEGGLTVKQVETLAPVTDFFAVGPEIWVAESPAEVLSTLLQPLR